MCGGLLYWERAGGSLWRHSVVFGQNTSQRASVDEVDSLEFPTVEQGEVVERTGQGLGLLQRVHRYDGQGYGPLRAVLPDGLHGLVDVRTLGTVEHGKVLTVDGLPLGGLCEAGLGAVEGEGQQLVVPGGVYGLKAKVSGEGLVREPRPLFGCSSMHTPDRPWFNASATQCSISARP